MALLESEDLPIVASRWSGDATPLVDALKAAVGARDILTSVKSTERYRKSFRGAVGDAVAVVVPTTLLALWRALEVAVAHDAIVIMQAQNTGLTNGSTPDPGGYDRPVVLINTLKLDAIQLLDGGKQVVSLPGGTLYRLEQLLKPLGREPHSVIGASCVGASIVGGVCNNSGGALVRRGPAYTELSLSAQIDDNGRLELVNHLGINLGSTPEEILTRLQSGDYTPADVQHDTGLASDSRYASRVRDIDEPSAARFNADPTNLHEAAGSAGKLCVFAVRLDTFAADKDAATYYIGTNNPDVLTEARRHLLGRLSQLPIAGEYMHRDMFWACRKYGRDTFLLIHYLGTDVMPGVFSRKRRIDATLNRWPFMPKSFADKVAQFGASFWPEMLPKKMIAYGHAYEHHLILKVAADSVKETEAILDKLFASNEGAYFRCTPDEGERAFLHRFSAGSTVARFAIMNAGQVEGIMPLDVALRRNDDDWFAALPPDIADKLHTPLYCAHFLCHVFHMEFAVKKGVDMAALKTRMLDWLESRGAQYPAEHNVGHLYEAKPAQVAFYRKLDPTNAMNPGIGKTTKLRNWRIANEP
jgi:D-lactate dehydrogenase